MLKHSAIFLTLIKLPSATKNFVLSIFERSLKTDFTVQAFGTHMYTVIVEQKAVCSAVCCYTLDTQNC